MLNFEQKNNIGLGFVFDNLKLSPLGKRKLRTLQPYTYEQYNELIREWDNTEKVFLSFDTHRSEWDKISFDLRSIKDIIGILVHAKTSVLSEVDFFEVKQFVIRLNDLSRVLSPLLKRLGLHGFELPDTAPVILLLDPMRAGSLSFSLDNGYSDRLAMLRKIKNGLETNLRLDPTNQNLIAERAKAASDEAHEERRILTLLSNKLSAYADSLIDASHLLGRLDLTVAKAFLAESWDMCRPVIGDFVSFEAMFNPAVADALEQNGKEFTGITVDLDRGTTVISGANMSGKSVALRTVALNVYIASLGFFAFADSAQIPLFDDIFLLSDDLADYQRGLSSFGGEVTALKEIAELPDDDLYLILLDEFARGTNPVEGARIAKGVADYFNSRNCVCVMTTHFDGVSRFASKHYSVRGLPHGCTFDSTKSLNELMDYSLVEVDGNAPVDQNAIQICKFLELPSDLLDCIENTDND